MGSWMECESEGTGEMSVWGVQIPQRSKPGRNKLCCYGPLFNQLRIAHQKAGAEQKNKQHKYLKNEVKVCCKFNVIKVN